MSKEEKKGTENNYTWVGEKLKQVETTKEKDHTPKDIIDALDNTRSQISQLLGSKAQIAQQLKSVDVQLANSASFEKEIIGFEEQAVKFQKERLVLLVRMVSEECKKKAIESSTKTIAKDTNAYTTAQKENLPYLDYQKNLATHPKIAERISRRIIIEDLHNRPVFDNPFK